MVPAMPMDFQPPPHSVPEPEPEPQIDIRKRYDVYCWEAQRGVVVYRNALFKGVAKLLPSSTGRVIHPEFLELEQANRQPIYISRNSIFRICAPGTIVMAELVTGTEPASG